MNDDPPLNPDKCLLQGVPPSQPSPALPPPPKSSVNVYELTFGTVCGLCAGVFVKKSARMVAFFVGGLFVVLQVGPPPHANSLASAE